MDSISLIQVLGVTILFALILRAMVSLVNSTSLSLTQILGVIVWWAQVLKAMVSSTNSMLVPRGLCGVENNLGTGSLVTVLQSMGSKLLSMGGGGKYAKVQLDETGKLV